MRTAGYKGVVLYNRYLEDELHESDGKMVPYKLALRPSMNKFTSIHYHLEVCIAANYVSTNLDTYIARLCPQAALYHSILIGKSFFY